MTSRTYPVRLADVTQKIGSGSTPRGGKKSYLGGSTSLIRSLNVHDDGFRIHKLAKINDEQASLLNNVVVEEDDVLFNITGASIARCCIVPSEVLPARVNQHVSIIRTNKKLLNPHYLRYLLILPEVKSKLISSSGGSSREAITKEQLEDLKIEVIDISSQESVAEVLTAIDRKIELNNKIKSQLEALAKLIYDYWFVQFDFPDEHGMPYKSSGGKMVWSEELKRKIPAGWVVLNLKDFVNIFDSERIPLSSAQRSKKQGKYPYYGATGVMDHIDDYIFDGEYILVAEDGSVETDKGFLIVQYIWGKTWVNNHAHVLQAKKNYNNEYLYSTLSAIPSVQVTTGSIQKKINQENLNKIKITQPTDEVLQLYSKMTLSIRSKLINTFKENQELSVLRDWLLPMLINGQVQVVESQL